MQPAGAAADAERLARASRRLLEHYPAENWWPSRSRFEVMVGAVLVQNTRWANVHRAIASLRAQRLLRPEALAAAGLSQLSEVIKPAGCQSVKAVRLAHLATGVVQAGGMRGLARQSSHALRALLRGWHGVGEETADAILLYGFSRPVFIADNYARRWLVRMGVFDAGSGVAAYARCRHYVEGHLGWNTGGYQALHAAIVLHGQQHCARQARCEGCTLNEYCDFIKQ